MMKIIYSFIYWTGLGVVLLLSTLLPLTHAHAQGLPPGNYKETCKNYTVIGPLLRAQCQKRDGSWQDSSIYFNRCEGSIWNDNGELKCNQRQYSKLPKGSYKETCKDYYVEGNRLEARCKKRDGSWRNTSINFKNCKDDIWNDNGELKCSRQYSNLPKGSYKETCKDYYIDGNILEAECKKRDGSWRHSSINFKNCDGGVWNDNGKLRCD